jgi:hypothetical protein
MTERKFSALMSQTPYITSGKIWLLVFVLSVASSTTGLCQNSSSGYSLNFQVSNVKDSLFCTVSTGSFAGMRAISFGLRINIAHSAADSALVSFSSASWIGAGLDNVMKIVKQRNGYVRVFAIQKKDQKLLSSNGGALFHFVYALHSADLTNFDIPGQSESSFSMVDANNALVMNVRPLESSAITAETPIHLEVFPNPGHGIYTMYITVTSPAALRFDVYDIIGRRIFNSVQVAPQGGVINRVLDFHNLPNGVYFLRALANFADGQRRIVTKKFLKIQ